MVGVVAGAAALASACSSSSSSPQDAGEEVAVTVTTDAASFPWCSIDEQTSSLGIVDECSRNQGECLTGSVGVTTCPTANLVGCCKGPAEAEGGEPTEVCIYSDDYLFIEGGEQSWCTCKPTATAGCVGGTWQTSP